MTRDLCSSCLWDVFIVTYSSFNERMSSLPPCMKTHNSRENSSTLLLKTKTKRDIYARKETYTPEKRLMNEKKDVFMRKETYLCRSCSNPKETCMRETRLAHDKRDYHT